MECRIEFRSPFETAKEAGLVSKKKPVNPETDWDSPKFEFFLHSVSESLFKTHPAAVKSHTYGSSLK